MKLFRRNSSQSHADVGQHRLSFLSVVKSLAVLALLFLTACTDYESDYEDLYGYLADAGEDVLSSSSDVILSSSQNQQSSSSEKDRSEYDASANTLKDFRDGQTYRTVTIGTQIWMAENLNYEYNEGSAKSYCYNNSASNCDKYGRLYLWSAAMDSAAVFSISGKGCGDGKTCRASGTIRGVCPEGWHLPSDDEWNILVAFVGGKSIAGLMLKNKIGWNDDGNGTDEYNFSAMPAGFYDTYNDKFTNVGSYTDFWYSTEYDKSIANIVYMSYEYSRVNLFIGGKNNARSIRCLLDSNEYIGYSSSSLEESNSLSAWDYLNPEISYGEVTDSRDSQVYKTVVIDNQTWMAENLNYAYEQKTSSEDSSSFCYKNSTANCDKYGRLYLWSAAMDSAAVFSTAGKGCGYGTTCSPSGTIRGVCPEGWHLPNDDEWNTLWTAVGGTSTAGKKLKSTSGWISSGNGTDSFGFAVLPAGNRRYDGDFFAEGNNALFWSSSEDNGGYAYYWSFSYYRDGVIHNDYDKYLGFSVRCLRDTP